MPQSPVGFECENADSGSLGRWSINSANVVKIGNIMSCMAKDIIHISEAEAARDFAGLLARVRAGAEIIIGDNARPVAVVRPAEPYVRRLSESLRLAKEHASTVTLDEDFTRDLEEVITSHREPLKPPAWD